MHPISINDFFNEVTPYAVCVRGAQRVNSTDLISDVARFVDRIKLLPHQNWILASSNTYTFLCGFLALLACGREILLPPNNQSGTINETINGADALLTDLEFETAYPVVRPDFDAKSYQLDKDISIEPSELYLQLCTSGSSGKPKQIRKSLATLLEEVNWLEKLWGEQLNEVTYISTVSHQHIYGLLFRVLWPLLTRRLFVTENIEYPEQIDAYIKRYGRVVLISSPAYLKRMVDIFVEGQFAGAVQQIFSSGGPLSRDTSLEYTHKLGVTPTEVLGSTETGGIASRQQQVDEPTPWQRMPVVQIKRDETTHALQVKSPFCYTDGWYQMGDAVELLDDVHFHLSGRIDRIVKLEEKRISLDAMEQQLSHVTWIEEARIVVLEGYRVILGAVCILSTEGAHALRQLGKREFTDQLKSGLLSHFDRVTLPRKWRYVNEFPYNTQGKTTQSDLRQLFEENSNDGTTGN